jgi:hypothetical protein
MVNKSWSNMAIKFFMLEFNKFSIYFYNLLFFFFDLINLLLYSFKHF